MEYLMNSEKMKDDKLRKKAEEILKNQFNPVKDQFKDDDYIHELRVHQIELEIQNQELQLAQIRLEDSRRKYFDLFNFAPVGYFTLDKDGIILDVNLTGALLLGVERLNLQKRAFIQYIDPNCRNKFHHHTMKVLETGAKQIVELKLLKKDNTSFDAHFETINIYDENGKFKEFILTLIDITTQKKIEAEKKTLLNKVKADRDKLAVSTEELKRSNIDLERFAYVSSHDLQEPLRMVTLYSQLLESRYKDSLDSDANDFIEYVVDNAKRMKQLIDDLLDYSRVSSQAKEFENVDLKKVLDIVLSNLSLSIAENNVKITQNALPTVFAEQNQMLQVFQNLILNSIKFKGISSPEIHISAQKGENEWIFSIKDNGIGIEPKHQDQIFEVFKRLHTRDEYPGTGIGLSIVKKIILHHGGRIWLESEPGKGSTFYFTIPINS
jgi:two-component system, chemotaxis family, sensor kinase Cph1